MKKHFDVKNELKKPAFFRQKVPGKTQSKRREHVFTNLETEALYHELMSDINFMCGKKPLLDYLLETLIHYWYCETKRKPRMKVAGRLNAARMQAHEARQRDLKRRRTEEERTAERLLEALLPSNSTKEAATDV